MDALLITDGECGFCQRSAAKLARIVPTGWTNLPNTKLPNADQTETYGLTPAQLTKSVWLIEFADSEIIKYSGAKAVGKVLRLQGGIISWIGWLTFIPPTSWIASGLYRLVANNRKFFGRFV
jgi:predicted DCC family thiol-disulfide oxidoreductase YuxK